MVHTDSSALDPPEQARRASFRVSGLSSRADTVRACYHAWRRRERSLRAREDTLLKEHIEQAYAASHQTYGAPRLQVELAEAHGIHVSRKRVARW